MAASDLMIAGTHAVRSALTRAGADCLELWYRVDSKADDLAELVELAASLGVAQHAVAEPSLVKLYGDSHHQGIVLRRRAPATLNLRELLNRIGDDAATPLILLLDTVQDPRNFGACLRAADGAGVDAVIFPRDKSARVSNVVAKTASGALDSLALVSVPNLSAAMRALKEAGIWLTGATHDASESLYNVDFTQASALVLGNEGSGLRRLTRSHCDYLVHIPMAGSVTSLNVATAAAVCLFEARRQRYEPACN